MRLLQIYIIIIAHLALIYCAPTDTTTYTNKYNLYNLGVAVTSVTNAASGLFPATVDTKLYLGDPYTGAYAPSINADYGLTFSGQNIALIKASNYLSTSSNWIQSTGTTLTMWVYIIDGEREQVLMCKAAKNSGSEVTDRLCLGIHNNRYYGTVYNETLDFYGVEVQEGWNFLALTITQDTTANLYTRLRLVAYSRAQVSAGFRTYSNTYYDDSGLDMVFGAKFDNNGIALAKGFVGHILEIRLYSNSALTIAQLDDQIDWDCTLSTKKLCDFCPLWVGVANVCLEDFTHVSRAATTQAYLKAQYNFDKSTVSGYGRPYYRSTLNSKSYDFYVGTAYPNARQLDNEPHLTGSNGLYFDGNDFLTQNTVKDIATLTSALLNFDKQITLEFWCRFQEINITQNYYLFQKINTFGVDKPAFQLLFTTLNEFVVELNSSRALVIPEAYGSGLNDGGWVYVGVSFAALFYPSSGVPIPNNIDRSLYRSKICAFIKGQGSFEKAGCSVVKDYYSEIWDFPKQWDTRVGNGMIGFIKAIYFWDYFKAPSNLWYTPRRTNEYRRLDRCSPFSMEAYPSCTICDHYQGSSTCFSSCNTNTYETYYSSGSCQTYNCSSKLCTTCYKDTSAFGDNYCTSCIPNAELTDGSLGNCKCKVGFYYHYDNVCLPCHPFCKSCYGPNSNQCYDCNPGRPRWNSICMTDCSSIDYPFNATYVYSAKDNTCTPCPDYFYSLDSATCQPQPYPKKLQNFNNKYIILEFSAPVKYSKQVDIKKILTVSIAGKVKSYDFTYSIPYWEPNQYSQTVFIELNIQQKLEGNEELYLQIDNVQVTDAYGYQLLRINATSKQEFIPLKVPLLIQPEYISESDRYIIDTAGKFVFISILVIFGVNIGVSLFSKGSLELMWSFLYIVQLINYVPLLNLQYPTIVFMMLDYFKIANLDISIFETWFRYLFNLKQGITFNNDNPLTTNYDRVGFSSMRFIMNFGSQLTIILAFAMLLLAVLLIKTMLQACFNRGQYLQKAEQKLYFNVFIRFYLVIFLDLNTSAYVNLYNLEFNDPLNIFCSILSIIMVCTSIIFPLANGLFLYQFKNTLQKTSHPCTDQKRLNSLFGILYSEYNFDNWYQYMYASIFVFRRLAFIIILITLHKHPLVQLITFQALNIAMILFLIIARPYKDPLVNSSSALNEGLLLVIGFYLFVFLDENQSESNYRFYAWVIITLALIMIAINIILIIGVKIKEVIMDCLHRAYLRRLRTISEIEQKYLFFDFRKFFMNSIDQQVRYHQQGLINRSQIMATKQVRELKPTELYREEEIVSDSTQGDGEIQFGDEMGPETTNNDTTFIPPPPEPEEPDNPLVAPSTKMDFDDTIPPDPYTSDAREQNKLPNKDPQLEKIKGSNLQIQIPPSSASAQGVAVVQPLKYEYHMEEEEKVGRDRFDDQITPYAHNEEDDRRQKGGRRRLLNFNHEPTAESALSMMRATPAYSDVVTIEKQYGQGRRVQISHQQQQHQSQTPTHDRSLIQPYRSPGKFAFELLNAGPISEASDYTNMFKTKKNVKFNDIAAAAFQNQPFNRTDGFLQQQMPNLNGNSNREMLQDNFIVGQTIGDRKQEEEEEVKRSIW